MKKNHRRIMHHVIHISLGIIAIVAALYAFWVGYEYVSAIQAESANRQKLTKVKQMTLLVDETDTIETIAEKLNKDRFITYKKWFVFQGKLYNYEDDLITGSYTLTNNMSDIQILEMLTTEKKAKVSTHTFTIPEGFTIERIGQRLEDEGIVKKDDFLKAAQEKDYDYDFLKDIPDDTQYTLEGYLFPDTYTVSDTVTSEEIIVMMLNRFKYIVGQYSQYLYNGDYSLHDIITIASIIEHEAKRSDERPLISGVIYNRINDQMPLQMCSTVQYVLEKRKSNLSYDDLEIDSPYNTYIQEGLPIGPICSPGQASIQAAFMPESHNYYFFVLKDAETGEHAFSETATQHSVYKEQYLQTEDINFKE